VGGGRGVASLAQKGRGEGGGREEGGRREGGGREEGGSREQGGRGRRRADLLGSKLEGGVAEEGEV
jgi:hypothetical protein